MANTAVAITAGAGTSIDTFTQASGDHRQAVVIGDSATTEAAEVVGAALVTRPVRSATATVSSVTAAATSTQLLAANTTRVGVQVFNDSTADMNLKYGTAASSTSFTVKLPPAGYWEMPPGVVYTGIIHGIWVAANGAGRITELT
jgi:hypothetical protein